MNDRIPTRSSSAWHLVLLVCIAQTLVQIGAFFWPALLPQLAPQWALSNSAAGWITAAFYGAYMLAAPVLVTLTDRVDPKPSICSGWDSPSSGTCSSACWPRVFGPRSHVEH
ncbi:MAG: hypothetical protein AB7E81_03265 [Hyphomicrobiaceae bacterium]